MTDQPERPQDGEQQQEPSTIVPPDDWYRQDTGLAPTAQPQPLAPQPAAPAHPGSRAEPMPSIEGVTFDRGTERNSRAIIAIVLSGIAMAGLLATVVTGAGAPLIVIVGCGIGGIVMGALGRASARNGLASNPGLALTAIILGALALIGVVAMFALLIYVLSQWT